MKLTCVFIKCSNIFKQNLDLLHLLLHVEHWFEEKNIIIVFYVWEENKGIL